jgi:hypothetical protein
MSNFAKGIISLASDSECCKTNDKLIPRLEGSPELQFTVLRWGPRMNVYQRIPEAASIPETLVNKRSCGK